LTRFTARRKLAAMQSLGLQGETKRSDGRLKSIFWPTVENAWDVDYLGRQGFWICLVIAALQIVFSAASGNPILIAFGAAEALLFFIGGMGVREATAVSELQHPKATFAEWHFPQENATHRGSERGTVTLKPL
jgi:hypothetical protein